MSTLVKQFRAAASPLPDDPNRLVVPEPVVKAALAERGLSIPRTGSALDGYTGPLVLKAFGPSLVHKSEVGAVQLGLTALTVNEARNAMEARLRPAGTFVEEQLPAGQELVVGVVDRPPFGLVLAFGPGGSFVEALDAVELRLLPMAAADAAALAHGFVRGSDAHRHGVAHAIEVIASLAMELNFHLAELECNPLIGGVAVDARCILHAEPRTGSTRADGPSTDFTRLFAPRSIAVAGASTSRETFGNRFLDAYRSFGWEPGSSLVAVHPSADSIGDVPAFPRADDTDYLLVAVPAERCAALLRAHAGRVRFAHVVSGGFGESEADDEDADADADKGGSVDGRHLEVELLAAAREGGMRLLGPNCMGVYSPAGRQTFLQGAPVEQGTVSVISQSGGLAGDIVKAGSTMGVRFSKLVTLGNSVDVTPGEMLDWMIDDPETTVVGLYLEDPKDGRRLVDALARAAGRVPVVALVGGLSRQGATAVASHTGALAVDRRVWQAIGDTTGCSIVETLEQFLAALAYLQRWCPAAGPAHRSSASSSASVPSPAALDPPAPATTVVIGPGGGASVLATDACDRAGLSVGRLLPEVRKALRGLGYGAGTSVSNPVEIPVGPAAQADTYHRALGPVLAGQAVDDVLIHVNVQAYYSYGSGPARLLETIELLGTTAPLPVRCMLVLRNLDAAPPVDVDAIINACRANGIVTTRTLDDASTAIAAAQRFQRCQRRRGAPSGAERGKAGG